MGTKLDKILKNMNTRLLFILLFSIEASLAPSDDVRVDVDEQILKPSLEQNAQVFSLIVGPANIEFKSVKVHKPSYRTIINSKLLTKRDKYAVKFINDDGRAAAIIGLGDPFTIHIDHIGYEDRNTFRGVVDNQPLKLAIPVNQNITSITLMSKDAFGLVPIKEIKIK